MISRSGATTTGPTVLSPEDLIAGWRRWRPITAPVTAVASLDVDVELVPG